MNIRINSKIFIKEALLLFLITQGLFWLFNETIFSQNKTSTGRKSDQFITSMNNIINDSILRPCFVGIKVVELKDGKTLYEYNSDKLFHPASNMKLLTTATAINLLPQEFRFVTELYSDGVLENNTLKGNLCIKGSGDPLFSTTDIESLLIQLKLLGIKNINGDLIGDVSLFDSLYWGEGWMWDDEPAPEETFITPLSINRNSIGIYVFPSTNLGDTLSYELEEKSSYFKIINHGITSFDTLIPICNLTRIKRENTLLITGRMEPGEEKQKFTFSIWKPELYFLEQFKRRLLENQISITGNTLVGKVERKIDIASFSTSLDSVVHRVNKYSDNLAAENLLKILASLISEPPYSSKEGLRVVREFLHKNNIDTSKIMLADGSGVSMYNAVSPNAIVSLLQNQYHNNKTFTRFHQSLSIAGVDGTLRNRLRGTLAEGNVHAKTGTLTGTNAISGYINNTHKGLIAFSIIINHCPCESAIIRNIQDRILQLLARE